MSAKTDKTKTTAGAQGAAAPKKAQAAGQGVQRTAAFLKKHWPQLLRPVAVLGCICLIVSALLAVTNYFTGPVIARADRVRANAARQELLPAEDFEALEGEWPGVSEAYRAVTDGVCSGYVITGTARGYGGDIPVLVAFDTNGVILGISISGTEETQGQGAKVEEPAFRSQFAGLAARKLELFADVQQVAGATVSSRAAVSAVNAAIDAYQQITGGHGGTEE